MIIRPGMFLTSTIGTGEGSSRALALLGAEPQGVAMDFRDLSVLVRDTGTPANSFSGNVNSWLTYTSPSTKYIRNAAGLLVSGTTLRTEYSEALSPLGIKVEPATTNLLLRSQEFSNASWTVQRVQAFGAGSVADVIAAPDGTTTADYVVEDASAATTHNMFQAVTITAGATVTYSQWFKADTRTRCRLQLASNGGLNGAYVLFNLGTGAVGASTVLGTGAYIGASIQAWLNGWYRCSLTATVDAAATSATALFGLVDAAGSISYDGDGVSGLYVWGAQAEALAIRTTYVPTAGSTVSRVADDILKLQTTFPAMGTTGSAYVMARLDGIPTASQFARLWSLSDAATSNDVIAAYVRHTTGTSRLSVNVGGVNQADLSDSAGTTITAGTSFKSAAAWAANDYAYSVNGVAVGTDVSSTVPGSAINRLNVGSLLTGNHITGHITQLLLVPRRKSNAELVAEAA